MVKINSSILTKVRITKVEHHPLDVLLCLQPPLGCPQGQDGSGHEPAPVLNVTNVSQLRFLVHISFEYDQVCPTPALGTRQGLLVFPFLLSNH